MSVKFPIEKGSKKIINAWASYDWANSVFFLVITSTIFPIYYSSLFVEKILLVCLIMMLTTLL